MFYKAPGIFIALSQSSLAHDYVKRQFILDLISCVGLVVSCPYKIVCYFPPTISSVFVSGLPTRITICDQARLSSLKVLGYFYFNKYRLFYNTDKYLLTTVSAGFTVP